MEEIIYDDSFYIHESETAEKSAPQIIDTLLSILTFKPISAVDIGCGCGDFLSFLKRNGVIDVLGIDGDYVKRSDLKIPEDCFMPFDITKPIILPRKYDIALCLEVAEHIDEQNSDVLIDSLVNASDIILFSAAIPGQGGTHHVNERWPQHWADKFCRRNYVALDLIRPAIWSITDIAVWYRQNIILFVNKEISDHVIAKHDNFLVIGAEHPDLCDFRKRELQKQVDHERARWSCSQSELVEVRNALQNTQWQLDHIRGELDQVYRSRSWRITRPSRYVLRQTRRIRHLARDLRGLLRIASQPMAAATNPVVHMQPPSTEWEYGVASHTGDRVPRLLIITPDLHGPIRNGGIGTAFSALAEAASSGGFKVTVLYTLGQHSEDGPISRWIEHYAAHGVRLIPLDDAKSGTPTIDAPWYRIGAWRVHTWLQQHQQQFDVVVFPEWMGLAYYVLLAKGQGLAYEGLPIVVNTHSPESWAAEGNRRMPEWPDDIDRDFMERESVRRADLVVSPSAYMFDWMREHRWQLPAHSLVIPNLMPKSLRMAPAVLAFSSQHIDRIVFFGRLEPRKGLKLFCDAIDRLPANVRKHIGRVTFLGKSIATPGGFDSRQFIAQRSAQWGVSVDVLTDRNRDGALAELEQPGTLAVIPSLVENSPYTVLECLMRGILFLASRVGGIPELLATSDHASHLFDPNPRALAQALEGAIMHGIQPAALAWDTEEVEQSWLTLLRSFSEKEKRNQPALTTSSEMPRVSVCLVHYNRPHLLAQALDSLRAQTYTNFEVVLVDDGSPSDEAKTYLEAIEHEFATRQWQIIRQQNSYLGAARNTAASAAQGDYLLFMDDDNVATPEMISTFVQAAVASGADVLTCPTMPFTGNRPPHKLERIWLPLGGAVGAGLYRNAFGDANALWKRSAFDQVGGYTTDYGVGHEDWELFADAVLCGLRLEVVPKPLYWYRVNKQGMLRTGDHWADHARSLRPYLRHDPQGLGMALAYGLFLQRLREVGTQSAVHRAARWRALLRAARLAGDPSLRAQFLGSMRSQGLRIAIRRALAKAGR